MATLPHGKKMKWHLGNLKEAMQRKDLSPCPTNPSVVFISRSKPVTYTTQDSWNSYGRKLEMQLISWSTITVVIPRKSL
jgi:hypothetical protein